MKNATRIFKDYIRGRTERETNMKIEFHMTSPIESHSITANSIDKVVSGNNLLYGTKDFELYSNNTDTGILSQSDASVQSEKYNDFTVRGIDSVPAPSPTGTGTVIANYNFLGFTPGECFTFSFFVKGTLNSFKCFFYGDDGYAHAKVIQASNRFVGSVFGDGNISFDPSEEWQRVWVTWQIDPEGSGSVNKKILIRTDGGTNNGSIYVCGCKLERGVKATDWTPMPEDVDEVSDVELKLCEQIFDEVTSTNNWATFETGRFKLDGSFSVPNYTKNYEYGYISSIMSDEEGNIDDTITIEFNSEQEANGITIIFQEPVYDFDVKLDSETYSVTGNQELTWVQEGEFSFKKMQINFKKINPHRRVRMLEIFAGEILVFGDEDIFSASIVNEIDTNGSTLPADELEFTVSNVDRKFDLLNPEGIYENLEKNQVIKAYIGVNIGNVFEYLQMGRYYLKEWKTDDIEASFTSYSFAEKIDSETDTYKFGRVEYVSLYDLMEELIQDIGLEYEIDPSVGNVEVLGCIGLVSKRDALRMMAQAGCCVVLSDETGRVIVKRIESISNRNVNMLYSGQEKAGDIYPQRDLSKQDRYVSADDMYEYPTITKSTPYANAEVSVSTFSIGTEDETLYSGTVKIPTNQTADLYKVWIEYENGPARITSAPSTLLYDEYAYGCFVYITEDTEITITGRQVTINTEKYSFDGNVDSEEQYSVDNTLIANEETAKEVADLALNTGDLECEIDYRGYAYLDVGDSVIVETDYGDREFAIKKQTFEYDGALSCTAEGSGQSG